MAAHRTNRKPSRNFIVDKMMSTSAVMTVGMLAFTGSALADANNPWADVSAVTGSITKDLSVSQVNTITQHTDRTVATAGSGDILSNQTVNILQNNSGSLFVLKTTGKDQDGSQIQGALNANGRVMVLDRNGVFFGDSARIDVGGIVASTGDVDNEAVMRGDTKLTLKDFGDASVINNGSITVNGSGLAALVAPHVANNGIIQARVGKVALASGGESATVDLYGDGLVELTVGGKTGKALAENTGTIEGSTVLMTASGAKEVVDTVINMSGVIKATSATVKGGKIVLGGGNAGVVKVSGKIDASGATGGGEVKVTGENVLVTDTAVIAADSTESGDGGNILVYGDRLAIFAGNIFARGAGTSGNGGNAEVSAGDSVGYYGLTDLTAENGNVGALLIDPEHLTISNAAISSDLKFILSGSELGSVNINDQALANTLLTSDVKLWATKTLSTGSNIDLSTAKYFIGRKITTGDLTLAAPTVNLNHDIILGKGSLNIKDLAAGESVLGWGIIDVPTGGIQVDTVNLNGKVFTRNVVNGATELAGDDQINSDAHTVNVKSNDASIQQGIYFANDAGGATVNVEADTYTEQLNIDKSLTLKGAGRDKTIINAPTTLTKSYTQDGREVYAVVHAHDATIDIDGIQINGATNTGNTYTANKRFVGVAYQNAGGNFTNNIVTGILTANNSARTGFAFLATDKTGAESKLDVVGNTFEGFQQYGVVLADNVNVTLTDNIITGDKDAMALEQSGLYVTSGAKVTATDNRISKTDTGVEIIGSANGSYIDNTLSDVHNGFSVTNSAKTQLVNNKIVGNSTTGVNLVNSHDSSVAGGSIDSFVTGINVDKSNNVTIDGVTLTDISDTHIAIKDSDNAKVQKNTMTGGKTGIALNKVTNSIIGGALAADKNTIEKTESGITVLNGSTGVTIQNNSIKDTSANGIHIAGGSNKAIVTGNTLNNIGKGVPDAMASGIFVEHSDDVRIGGTANGDKNTITGVTWDGVKLEGGNRIEVLGNKISAVERVGIYSNNTNTLTIDDNKLDDVTRALLNSPYGAITTEQGSNVTVSNNIITDSTQGVRVWKVNGKKNAVTGNTINSLSDNGVHVEDTTGLTVSGNNIGLIDGPKNIGGSGVYVSGSNNAKIKNNTIHNAVLSGIHTLNTSGLTVGGSSAEDGNTTIGGKNGIRVENATGTTTIRHNKTSGATDTDAGRTAGYTTGVGILVSNTTGTVKVLGNTANKNMDGIRILKTNGATVADNTSNQNSDKGIIINDSDLVKVRENNADGNKVGIWVELSEGVALDDNTIENSKEEGVYLRGSTHTLLENNDILTNKRNGVRIENSNDSTLHNNTITGTATAKIGVNVTGSSNAVIGADNTFFVWGPKGNTISDFETGVSITGGDNNEVVNNTVSNVTNGVVAKTSNDLLVRSNDITGSSHNSGTGINVTGGNNVIIGGWDVLNLLNTSVLQGNNISNFRDGILAKDVMKSLNIEGNRIKGGTTGTGIGVTSSENVVIGGNGSWVGNLKTNAITGFSDGIAADDSDGVEIVQNLVSDAAENGIFVKGSSDALVKANTIKTTVNGIVTDKTDRLVVKSNVLVGRNNETGIGISTGNSDDVKINSLNVVAGYDTGIAADTVTNLVIKNNGVVGASADGIIVRNSQGAEVIENVVGLGNGNGITAVQSDDAVIKLNIIGLLRGDGVIVDGSGNTRVDENTILHVSGNGIVVDAGNKTLIRNNTVRNFGGNGIAVSNELGKAKILNNDIRNGNGEASDGIHVANNDVVVIRGNTIDNVSGDGIEAVDNNRVRIVRNEIGENGFITGNGIVLNGNERARLLSNVISNAGANGLYAAAEYNGLIELVGNTFNNNPVGALFESGTIDLTSENANTFNGGNVAMRFAPIGEPVVEGPGDDENGEGGDEGNGDQKFLSFKMMEEGRDPTGLRLVDNTIGTTIFNGQTTYYVELSNGALFAPGTPTVLNGLNATYDGFRPSTVGGVLTKAQFDAIEAKIYHYNDANSLGLFFFGAVPGIDDEDAYNRFGQFTGAAAKFRLTLAGLPRLPGSGTGPVSSRTQAPGFQGNVANFLASLAPAAGGEGNDNKPVTQQQGIEVAGELANMEPAAGANDNADVQCWSQAASQASAGASVSYSFGGSMEETLSQAASCGGSI